MNDPFSGLPKNHFKAVLADPPWHFAAWSSPTAKETRLRKGTKNYGSSRGPTYDTMDDGELFSLNLNDVSADDCVLFLWTCWPVLKRSLAVIDAWGFTYKTCAFSWMKADPYRLFALEEDVWMGLGYWTRSNSEVCLLATKGHPKRTDPGVRQGIIEKAREHSRKPDCVHERIERLVAGPYLELFARQSTRPGWTFWGNQTERFNGKKDMDQKNSAALDPAGLYRSAAE